mmetsp:Transcript_20860/g.37169  ORF Transcript_20860/g.37169 Transcript_20860/m.37169 type:complete len:215 (-) Transcript_20860:259-903(-)
MPVVPLGVALLCAGSQYLAVYSCFFLGVPPQKFMPEATRYLGRFMFLTFQSNCILTLYYSVALLACIISSPQLDTVIMKGYPLAFALALFLTSAYYGLDHFNPEQIKRRKVLVKSYPYIHYDVHFQHGLAAPFMLFYTFCISPLAYRPSANWWVLGYLMYYLFQTHVNKFVTGFWPYPIIDDLERAGGAFARNAFFVTLTLIFVGLGRLSLLAI